MGERTLRYAPKAPGVHAERSKPGAGAYWRRRFIVLGVCLAALAAAAWSTSHVLTVQPTSSAGRTGTSGAGANGGTSAAGSTSRQGDTASAGGQAGPGRGQASSPGARQSPGASAAPTGRGRPKPGFCPWSAVVLSVTANQARFGPVQQPVFKVSVVSTQRTACSFDIGPGHLALVIKAASARIWSSGDCVNEPGSLVTKLSRGIPATVSIAWDKGRSSPGCGGLVRPVPSGGYTAYAVDGPLVSAPLAIRLR